MFYPTLKEDRMFEGGLLYQAVVVIGALVMLGAVLYMAAHVLNKESEALGHKHDH
jgi:hypothetical protein